MDRFELLEAESRLVLDDGEPLAACGLTLDLAEASEDLEAVAEELGLADAPEAEDALTTDLCGEECDEEALELPEAAEGDDVRELLDERDLSELLSAEEGPDVLEELEEPETF